MLTADTKRHIDGARQVLVGKVPDPKQQIDQITNALIYKFMDDMDEKSRAAGGKASFFTGELEPYAWRKLMDPRKGAQERLNMYTEALEKFSTAAGLPQLFRDIFRQAFLPYRDPETLNLFLKEIEFFDYNHSEELGNAFEYLLSIMGSQGDAGQFRTPRHIIDFMVDIIDPDYTDTILDPACGTAGFLISAYKHIVEKHDGVDADGKKNNEAPLTHQQKQKLMDNLEGYDISSDMVKLARVNMYLHDNRQPKIFEYDTLTSEERWGDDFDVIMANPPFMSPKGGIRPHKKFGVESSRAEVLFVDYIASHLKQNGRAGIIVPEGIIFQSGTAYKQLRKMLIDNGLWCVVSLPAGVFNPYSGVKTSILIIDKVLAKKFNHVMFLNIQSDGFDLGANRRPVLQNDLHNAIVVINEAKKQIRNSLIRPSEYFPFEDPEHVISIAPLSYSFEMVERIREEPDSTFQSSRYTVAKVSQNQRWPMVRLDEIINLNFGTRITKKNNEGTKYPVYGGGGISFRTDSFNRENEYVISRFAMSEHCVRFVRDKFFMLDSGFTFEVIDSVTTMKDYVGKVLGAIEPEVYKCGRGHAQKNIDVGQFKNIRIPLPPIEVQEQIVEELDDYQKIIDGAHQVVENYKPTIKIDPSWPTTTIGRIANVKGGKRIPKGMSFSSEQTKHPYLRVVDMVAGTITDSNLKFIDEKVFSHIKNYVISVDDIYITIAGSIGRSGIVPDKLDGASLTENAAKLVANREQVNKYYLTAILQTPGLQNQIQSSTMGVGVPKLALKRIAELTIPLPPLSIQLQIVNNLQKEQTLIETNKKVIKIYEQKIKDKITEVWN